MNPAVRCASYVGVLRDKALRQPDGIAFKFARGADAKTESWTYAQLDGRARALAARLRARGLEGERVLLLCPPGLDYIGAFFGCLYAGAIAVPVYPPRPNRSLRRLETIAVESGARAALTTESVRASLHKGVLELEHLAELEWLLADDVGLADASAAPADAAPDAVAFLQYTSGSTASPKGVMVSHRNLMHNSALIQKTFRTSSESRSVLWLPPYHDMGLIGGILQAVYCGIPLTLMPPASFLQQPLRWLEMMSRERATHSAAPNFAYDLCLRSVTPEQRDTLDLGAWSVALCGSEPIRAETLERFAEFFAPAGFRREAFRPCFGLAEATLLVSARTAGRRLAMDAFDAAALAANTVLPATGPAVRRLVGAGAASVERVEIVDPKTRRICAANRIGEIWVRDPSVAQGYWNRPAETEHTFNARLADGGGPFMRTGDLGFLRDGELFVTGRLKELIILRGRNYYPQDLEAAASASHPALRPGSNAAFSIERNGEEHLVLVLELVRTHRDPPIDEVAAAVRRAIAEEFEIEVDTVVLVPPLGVPKTSSGKLERQGCRKAYEAGELRIAAVSQRARPLLRPVRGADCLSLTPGTIQAWIVERLAAMLEMAPAEVDCHAPFSVFGLDSMKAVALSGDLETWLGRALPATLLWDYPTIDALSRHLAGADEVASDMRPPLGGPAKAPRARDAEWKADLERLSEDELSALLAEKIATLGGQGIR